MSIFQVFSIDIVEIVLWNKISLKIQLFGSC